MAFMTADDGTRLFYRLEGPDDAPPIILSNSLGTDHMMWQPQVEALGHAFRVVRYDQRGHGASDSPAGPFTIERLGLDVLALADHLGLERFSFCGISMGGLRAAGRREPGPHQGASAADRRLRRGTGRQHGLSAHESHHRRHCAG
jgi:pimeloyl-ACP methyl ester carboxylesterase